MEETSIETSKVRLRRLLIKAASFGAVAAIVGWGAAGYKGGVGAFVGAIAAAVYVWGFLESHISRANRDGFFDTKIAKGAGLRMAFVLFCGAGTYLGGKIMVMAFLVSLAAIFALLVMTEIAHIKKDLKTRGLIGGGI